VIVIARMGLTNYFNGLAKSGICIPCFISNCNV